MDADGDFQMQEQELLKHMINTHPEFRGITHTEVNGVCSDLYNQLSVGMEKKHILEQLSTEFTEHEKQVAFALASEICAADFQTVSTEIDFLNLLVELWQISEEIVFAIRKSVELRYKL